jgi:hypothetical protein
MPSSAPVVAGSSTKTARIPAQRTRARRTPPAAPPLGSLTQAGAREGARCTVCGSDRVTRISMNLTDGSPVCFTSCHRCENRSWNDADGGAVLPVEHVLDKARKPR